MCTSCWRRVGGSCENCDSADFAHRSASQIDPSRESEVRIASTEGSCERCKMSSAAPSLSEFCGSNLFLASLAPPPISHALNNKWKTPVALLEPPPTLSASSSCSDVWKTAIASLEPSPITSASRDWSRSKSKETSRDWHRVSASQLHSFRRLPRSLLSVCWRAFSRTLDVIYLRASLRRHIFCRGVANSFVGDWSVRQSQPTVFGQRQGAENTFATRCHCEDGRRSIVAFAVAVGNFCYRDMERIK